MESTVGQTLGHGLRPPTPRRLIAPVRPGERTVIRNPSLEFPSVSEAADGVGPTVVLIGEGDLSDEVATALESGGAAVERLLQPDEDDLREALEGDAVNSVAVVAREDAFVLRMALIVRSVSAEVPLLLTIFDQTMAEQVADEVQ